MTGSLTLVLRWRRITISSPVPLSHFVHWSLPNGVKAFCRFKNRIKEALIECKRPLLPWVICEDCKKRYTAPLCAKNSQRHQKTQHGVSRSAPFYSKALPSPKCTPGWCLRVSKGRQFDAIVLPLLSGLSYERWTRILRRSRRGRPRWRNSRSTSASLVLYRVHANSVWEITSPLPVCCTKARHCTLNRIYAVRYM